MEPLTLKPRQVVDSPDVEQWDDDDFDNLDDVQFRAASTATSIVSQYPLPNRDSSSSRLSIRSDSNQGDENWDVLVDEQASLKDAIALAKSKGIPLPANVPRSALEGGTIRRLRGKEIKKVMADDWSEDLELPSPNLPLKLAKHEDRDLSESLRQISAAFRASPKAADPDVFASTTIRSPKTRAAIMPVSLDAFRDTDEDGYFGDVPTIKVVKQRQTQPQKLPVSEAPPTPIKVDEFNLEDDLELPTDGQLKLSTRKPAPRTPEFDDDFDIDWAEGSLGIRDAGTKRTGPSARSSSASALSPTLSSAVTVESEDEALEGLEFPEGPIKFSDKLRQLQEAQALETETWARQKPTTPSPVVAQNDFFDELEVGDGNVFDTAKLTLNRNVKHKTQRASSPSKRTTTTLNFTTAKTQGTISRLPRFQTAHDRHERARSNLEPVSETGAAVSQFQRPSSRLATHAANSTTTIPGPVPHGTPSTPSRRSLRTAESRSDMRGEPVTTTNAQLLRAKRSMPAMRGLASPSKPTTFIRPPSRQDIPSRLNFSARPRTPTERADSRQEESRKPGVPFLSSRLSNDQSGLTGRSAAPRSNRRSDSDVSTETMTAAQKSLSRIAALSRAEISRGRSTLTAAELAAQAKKTITKPTRKRDYGIGNELDVFDDLPTSATVESRFTKAPIAKGPPRSLRSKLGLSHLSPSTTSLVSTRAGADTPTPMTPLSPPRAGFPTTVTTTTTVPRFARDTAASRNAREQRQISTTFQNIRGEPLQPISANWKTQTVLKQMVPPPSLKKPSTKKPQNKPHLIKPLGNDVNRPKTEKGMQWNPLLFCWEGNENALTPFEVPDFHPRDISPVAPHASPGTMKANMATIQNVGGNMAGVQVVGGMVFDPRQMKWLKLAENHAGEGSRRGGSVGSLQLEEEEDVFAGLEDLKEEDENKSRSSFQYGGNVARSERSRAVSVTSGGLEPDLDGGADGNSSDEWGGVAEEFDVGPEFVKRQRSEEERWRRKVEKWLRKSGLDDGQNKENHAPLRDDWRWAIRDLVGAGSNM